MTFKEFCTTLDSLEQASGRNDMIDSLAELAKRLDKDELKEAMYLLQGRIAPLFMPVEFQLSNKSLIKALATINESAEDIFKQVGDIGLAAEQIAGDRAGDGLSILGVFNRLEEIAVLSGTNSQAGKQQLFVALYEQLSGLEARYVSRVIIGKLRLGVSEKSVLDALSIAVAGDKSKSAEIRHAFGVMADLGEIAEIVLGDGVDALANIKPKAGVPVAVKLVEREKDVEKIFERFGEHIMQPKFDGLRAEIHFSKQGFTKAEGEQKALIEAESDHVRIFSRRMENLTDMFPDLIEAVSKLPVESVILDSEAIAYNPASGELLPFAETMKRKRKNDIKEMAEQIPIQAHCFDILMLNGKSLLKTPVEERLKIMEDLLKDSAPTLLPSESPVVKSSDDAQEVFDKYVDMGLEGIISKAYGTHYDPGTRNYDWIKLKAAANSELADTVDAVVLGYYLGGGARAKLGIGAFLIGVPDGNGGFVSLSKVGTGITDDQFVEIKTALDNIAVPEKPSSVRIAKSLLPDVFVNPEIVVVVEADSISQSQLHGAEEGGYSLRFPRLKEFDRQDKAPQDATSVSELEKLMKLAGGK